MPKVLYLRFPGCTFKIGNLEPGVFPLTRNSRTWMVNTTTGVTAKRTSFFAVPDFGSTVHQVQGKTIKALLAGTRDFSHKFTFEDLVHLYVTLSRLPSVDGLCLLQPFSKDLCQNGPPPEPSIMQAYLKGEDRWQVSMIKYDQVALDRMSQNDDRFCTKLTCASCKFRGRNVVEELSTTKSDKDQWVKTMLHYGSWFRCTKCANQLSFAANGRNGGKAGHKGGKAGHKGAKAGAKAGHKGAKAGHKGALSIFNGPPLKLRRGK